MIKYLFNIIILSTLCLNTAFATVKKIKTKAVKAPIQTSLVVDAKTGRVLHQENSNKIINPASLTKVATLYMVFDAIESGKLSLDSQLLVSTKAESMRPSKLWLKAGETISVRDAIKALIVKSANDASVVCAEAIGGNEANFARVMTKRMRSLGMYNTSFYNASGWHHPNHKTTALDLAKLSLALKRDHKRFYPLFALTSFEFRGRVITGHNKVTANYVGAEGLKTGYTGPAGFNLITTAKRGEKNLIAVVTGGRTSHERDQKMVGLLDTHFGIKQSSVLKPTSVVSKDKPIITAVNKVKNSIKVSSIKPINKTLLLTKNAKVKSKLNKQDKAKILVKKSTIKKHYNIKTVELNSRKAKKKITTGRS